MNTNQGFPTPIKVGMQTAAVWTNNLSSPTRPTAYETSNNISDRPFDRLFSPINSPVNNRQTL